jgi:hypothetical protein
LPQPGITIGSNIESDQVTKSYTYIRLPENRNCDGFGSEEL